ncbi:phytanoyl-CoA dioxygenase family protein [Kolteria novifilia]|uniref:phytanoyl-CoA dioxygenase family protein n=1 Tax=Kolteria novifilia TaxID=2527975 RepID=UPI003AF3EFBE
MDIERFDRQGWLVVPSPFESMLIDRLAERLEPCLADGVRRGGARNMLEVPEVRELSAAPALKRLVEPLLGRSSFAVRGILFDKTPESNWKVVWHQDLSIAVCERYEVAGYGPWSVKEGVDHVQPSTDVLEGMLAVRIHLDRCGEENGPLRVVPGSHRCGKLPADRIARLRESGREETCLAERDDVLLMRPLLLHASSAATSPSHRRVLHLEFASTVLPSPLRWYQSV